MNDYPVSYHSPVLASATILPFPKSGELLFRVPFESYQFNRQTLIYVGSP
jgi:hypothetical protein